VNAVVLIPHIRDILEEARKLLVVIQFELNQYLNTKRTGTATAPPFFPTRCCTRCCCTAGYLPLRDCRFRSVG
jgi:hypothetical protein